MSKIFCPTIGKRGSSRLGTDRKPGENAVESNSQFPSQNVGNVNLIPNEQHPICGENTQKLTRSAESLTTGLTVGALASVRPMTIENL
jgi:hypothetical protein